jgi:branched-chain amino acid transport system permease protein
VVLTYLAQWLFSADFRTINPAYAGASLAFGGLTLPVARLAAFGVALLLAALTGALLQLTDLGRAIRATAQNLVAARLYGIDPRHIYALTFGIGAALAGAAGGLYGMVAQVTPYMGAGLTAKSFVIAIIGGLANPLSVVLGGLVIGLAGSATSILFGTTYADVVSFGLLVVVLVLRPARQLRAG